MKQNRILLVLLAFLLAGAACTPPRNAPHPPRPPKPPRPPHAVINVMTPFMA